MRSGISLLEVLFSIFILAVALLGLASMIPVGQHAVTEAGHADRGASIGQQALAEMKVRDMLDPESWVQYDFGTSVWVAFEPDPATVTPFVIDPLAVTANLASASPDSQYAVFPHGPANFPTPAAPTFPKMPRISIQDLGLFESTGTLQPYGASIADRLFRISDDLQFELPTDATHRPVLVNPSGSPQGRSAGDYSWLAMIAPQPRDEKPYIPNHAPIPPEWPGGGIPFDPTPPGQLPLPPYGFKTVVASVVVFYRRDLVVASDPTEPASERIVYLDLVNGGLGAAGGDVQLRVTGGTKEVAEKAMKVRPNQWIMVSSFPTSPIPNLTPTAYLPVHRWYRVISTSELNGDTAPWTLDVTLAGSDLPSTRTDAGITTTLMRDIDGDASNGFTCHATICDGVIGVFEKVIRLDEPSSWSAH